VFVADKGQHGDLLDFRFVPGFQSLSGVPAMALAH
jgi:hypothetical protein